MNPEEAVSLPEKVTNFGNVPTLQPVGVKINGYYLSVNETEVYQFELRFTGERTAKRKGQEQLVVQEFAKGPKNDVAKENRRKLHWQLFQQLLAQNHDFFGNEKRNFTYDCALLLYCTNDLRLPVNQKRDFVLNVDRAALEQRCSSYIANQERIKASLLRTGTVNLRNAAASYIQGDRSVVQYLEILSSQHMFEQGQHYCFGNRMYEQEQVIRLGGGRGGADPRILKPGMQKNVRFVGDDLRNAQPIVQIDPKKSAFFPAMTLMQFIGEFFDFQNEQQLERNFQNVFDRANKQIRGLVLETTYMPQEQLQFSTHGLTRDSASDLYFERDGNRVSVANHIQQTYQLNLRFPRLPCVIQKKTGRPDSYFPIELVRIVQGQRIPIDKHTPNLTEQMIRICQVLPENLEAQIDGQRERALIQGGNPFFRAQQIRVPDTNLIYTQAAIIYPPAIQYEPARDVVEPERSGAMKWTMIGRDVPRERSYTIPAKWPKVWAVVIVQNAVGMQQCGDFCKKLVDTAKQRGLDANMPPRVDHFTETSIEYIHNKFQFYQQHSCMFVLFFAPGKRNAHAGDIHHVMKLMEQRHEVLTQHISPEIMNKGAGAGGGAAMVIENIMFKTNLKLGGANYNLATSTLFKQASRNQQDVLGNIWLGGNRMFFGIAMSHAPPQSLYERQTGKAVAIPTVVGMAYTTGKAMLRMQGTYWMQQPRVATMTQDQRQPLIERIVKAMNFYESSNSKFPEHIIVFRGGASEGEFKRINYWEGEAFPVAFRLIKKQRPEFLPPAVTMIVCQRQSNYRVIPERIQRGAKAPDQNVQPGTVVDSRVMNAAVTEFLLVAHKALQGTAQPVRCTVVFEWRPDVGPAARIPLMPLQEIENITYALCYSHGICCMSTAVPGVLYSADELAKRGRNNWKMHSEDGADVPQFDLPPIGEGNEQAQLELNQQRAEYFARVSNDLNPSIPTKFWA